MAGIDAPNGFRNSWSDDVNLGGGVSDAEKKDWDEVEEVTNVPTLADFTDGIKIVTYDGKMYVKDGAGNIKTFDVEKFDEIKIKKGNYKPNKNDFKNGIQLVQWRNKFYLYNEDTDKVISYDINDIDEVEKMTTDPLASDFKDGITLIQHDDKLFFKADNGDVIALSLDVGDFIKSYSHYVDFNNEKNTMDKRKGNWITVKDSRDYTKNGIYLYDGTNWEQVLNTASVAKDGLIAWYSPDMTYDKNGLNMCVYNGNLYRCVQNNVNGKSPTQTQYWNKITGVYIDDTIDVNNGDQLHANKLNVIKTGGTYALPNNSQDGAKISVMYDCSTGTNNVDITGAEVGNGGNSSVALRRRGDLATFVRFDNKWLTVAQPNAPVELEVVTKNGDWNISANQFAIIKSNGGYHLGAGQRGDRIVIAMQYDGIHETTIKDVRRGDGVEDLVLKNVGDVVEFIHNGEFWLLTNGIKEYRKIKVTFASSSQIVDFKDGETFYDLQSFGEIVYVYVHVPKNKQISGMNASHVKNKGVIDKVEGLVYFTPDTKYNDIQLNFSLEDAKQETEIWRTVRPPQCAVSTAYCWLYTGGDHFPRHKGAWEGIDTRDIWINSALYNKSGVDNAGINGAMRLFDGQKYEISNSGFLLNGRSWVISFWWFQTKYNGVYMLGSRQSGIAHECLHIGWRNSNKFTVAFYGDDFDIGLKRSDYMQKWMHVVIRFNKDNKRTVIWVDGENKGSHYHNNIFKGYLDSVNSALGANTNGGFMSNLRVWESGSGGNLIYSDGVTELYAEEKKMLLL